MAKPNQNPGFQTPLARILIGAGGACLLISGIMALTGRHVDVVRLILLVIGLGFFIAGYSYAKSMNKKLNAGAGQWNSQPQQWGGPQQGYPQPPYGQQPYAPQQQYPPQNGQQYPPAYGQQQYPPPQYAPQNGHQQFPPQNGQQYPPQNQR